MRLLGTVPRLNVPFMLENSIGVGVPQLALSLENGEAPEEFLRRTIC